MQLMVFSKHLAGLPLDETARRLRAMNIDAIDLTVRPGGHVEPERAADDLPRAAEVLGRQGVRIGMITTAITDAHDGATAAILRAAAGLDIGFYKLGYFQYDGFGSLRRQRLEVAARLKDLAALGHHFGIKAGFHNHSGAYCGASLWDIEHVLQDIVPEAMGVYLDPAHATIEGGAAGWQMGMDLLAGRIIMLAVKDFRWIAAKRANNARGQDVQFCPLQDGNVAWPKVLENLKTMNFDGPVSLHSEYQGAHSFADLSVDEVFAQTARDAAFLRGVGFANVPGE